MQDSYCIGITLYNENKSFRNKISLFQQLGYRVYIYDNSPSSQNARNYLDFKNIHYFTCGKNIGLGVAMSTLCAQAFYDGFDRLLFLDQDTAISEQTVDFIHKVNSTFDLNDYLAISFSNDNVNLPRIKYYDEYIVNDVKVVRNSGTLFNLDNLKIMNWFDTSFFVDGVDYEFSLNANLHNFKLGLINGIPDFDHVSEQGYENYNFFGKKIFYRTYNISRIYDVTKSSIKLIFRALSKFRYTYAYLFFKHWAAFITLQSVLRISKKEKNEK